MRSTADLDDSSLSNLKQKLTEEVIEDCLLEGCLVMFLLLVQQEIALSRIILQQLL